MYRLRLIKGKTYWGIVKASAEQPVVEVKEKKAADRLVESGYFVLEVAKCEQAENVLSADESENTEYFEDMFSEETEEKEMPFFTELQEKTKVQLVEYAEQRGIDIAGCKTKDDYIQRIIKAMTKAEAARSELRSE